MSKEKMGMRIGESVFSAGYLLFDLTAGIIFLQNAENSTFLLYGIMTLVLGLGDAFHLVPRIIKNIKGESEKIARYMNIGLAVTSVTMTVFYIMLYYVWKSINQITDISIVIPFIIWFMAIARIVICLLPQNNWLTGGNRRLSLCRNCVFAVMGAVLAILFFTSGGGYNIATAVCILLSFAFYIPVTLYSKQNPKIAMLMIPKTIMYIIIISLGLAMI